MGGDLSKEQKLVRHIGWIDDKKGHNWRKICGEFVESVPLDFKDFESMKPSSGAYDSAARILHRLLLDENEEVEDIVLLLNTLHRLVRTTELYKYVGKCSVRPVVNALSCRDPTAVLAALEVIRSLITADGIPATKTRQTCKEKVREVCSEAKCMAVTTTLISVFDRKDGDAERQVLAKALDVLSLYLLKDMSTSPLAGIRLTVSLLSSHSKLLMRRSQDPDFDIREHAASTLTCLLLYSERKDTEHFQDQALRSGLVLWHFYHCVASDDVPAACLEQCRILLAVLLGSEDTLRVLDRMLPPGLLDRRPPRADNPAVHISDTLEKRGLTKAERKEAETSYWWALKSGAVQTVDWQHVFTLLDEVHYTARLIWSPTQKAEMLDALKSEIKDFEVVRELQPMAEWDFESFSVNYESLRGQLQVDGFYLRRLLEAFAEHENLEQLLPPDQVGGFVTELMNHCVVEDQPIWKLACLRVVSALYERYPKHLSTMKHIPYLVWLLAPEHTRPMWRDHIIRFMSTLLKDPTNARSFVDAKGIESLQHYMQFLHRSDSSAHKRGSSAVHTPSPSPSPAPSQPPAVASDENGAGNDSTFINPPSLSVYSASTAAAAVAGGASIAPPVPEDDNEDDDDVSQYSAHSVSSRASRKGGSKPGSRAGSRPSSRASSRGSTHGGPKRRGPRDRKKKKKRQSISASGRRSRSSGPPVAPGSKRRSRRRTRSRKAKGRMQSISSTQSSLSSLSSERLALAWSSPSDKTRQVQSSGGAAPSGAPPPLPPRDDESPPDEKSEAIGADAKAELVEPEEEEEEPDVAQHTPRQKSNRASDVSIGTAISSVPSHRHPGQTDEERKAWESRELAERKYEMPFKPVGRDKTDSEVAAAVLLDDRDVLDKRNVINVVPPELSNVQLAKRCLLLFRLILVTAPRLKKSLCTPSTITSLAHLSLSDNSSVVDSALNVLTTLLEANVHQIPHLAKSGLFLYLLYAARKKCSPTVAQFLHRFHMKQAAQYLLPDAQSVLAPFLPGPLVRVLHTEGAESFRKAFSGNSSSPTLVWNSEYRGMLKKQLEDAVAPIKKHLHENPNWYEEFVLPPPFAYPGLDEELCVGTVYLSSFCEHPRAELRDPINFMEELIQATVTGHDLPVAQLELVLRSQLLVLERFPQMSAAKNYSAMEPLLRVLSRDELVGISVLDVSLQLLERLQLHDESNLKMCVDANGINILIEAVQRHSARLEEVDFRAPLPKMLEVLSRLPLLDGIRKTLRAYPMFLATLRSLMMPSCAAKWPDVTVAALMLVQRLSDHFDMQFQLLQSGCVVPLVYLAVFHGFSPAQDTHQRSDMAHQRELSRTAAAYLADSDDEEDSKSENKQQEDAAHDVRSTAVDTLHCIAYSSDAHPTMAWMLRHFIGWGLYHDLRKPKLFLDTSRQTTVSPTCVWTDDARKELRAYLEQEMVLIESLSGDDIAKWPHGERHSTNFAFVCLREYVTVEGIYLNEFVRDGLFVLPNRLSAEQLLKSTCDAVIERTEALRVEEDQKSAIETIKPKPKISWRPIDDDMKEHMRVLSLCCNTVSVLVQREAPLMQSVSKRMLKELRLLGVHTECGRAQQIVMDFIHSVKDNEHAQAFLPSCHRILHLALVMERSSCEDLPDVSTILECLGSLFKRHGDKAAYFFEGGGLISLLNIITLSEFYSMQQRLKAVHVYGLLMESSCRNDVELVTELVLAKQFIAPLREATLRPTKFIDLYDGDVSTPFVYWNADCRKDVRAFLAAEAPLIQEHQFSEAQVRLQQGPHSAFPWVYRNIDERFPRVTFKSMLCVGGVFIHSYNANPFAKLDTKSFLPELLDALESEFDFYKQVHADQQLQRSEHAMNNLTILLEAAGNVITNSPAVADWLVADMKRFDFFCSFLARDIDLRLRAASLPFLSNAVLNSNLVNRVAQRKYLARITPLLWECTNMSTQLDLVLNTVQDLLKRSSLIVAQFLALGGLAHLLVILINHNMSLPLRTKAAATLGACVTDDKHGAKALQELLVMLTPNFEDIFQSRPEVVVQFVDTDHVTDDGMQWTASSREGLLNFLGNTLHEMLQKAPLEWSGNSTFTTDCVKAYWMSPPQHDDEKEE